MALWKTDEAKSGGQGTETGQNLKISPKKGIYI